VARSRIEGFGNHGIYAEDCEIVLRELFVGGSENDQIRARTGSRVEIVASEIANSPARGIHVSSLTGLIVSRTLVVDNRGGGIDARDGSVELVNNLIVENGSGGSSFGGVRIDAPTLATFAFNTVEANRAEDAAPAYGVECRAASSLVATSSIVYGGDGPDAAVAGSCSWRYSNIRGAEDLDSDGTNVGEPPGFAAAGAGDYRLTESSPCVGAAEPDTGIAIDFAGESRPVGDAPDCGAFEYVDD
jgi:hypothetical protein